MKLKCVRHDRRVVVTDTGRAVHRCGAEDDMRCDSPQFTLGTVKVAGVRTIRQQIRHRRNRRVGAGLRAAREATKAGV